MSTPTPTPSSPLTSSEFSALDVREAHWARLLDELAALHARLEYVRLMLKLDAARRP